MPRTITEPRPIQVRGVSPALAETAARTRLFQQQKEMAAMGERGAMRRAELAAETQRGVAGAQIESGQAIAAERLALEDKRLAAEITAREEDRDFQREQSEKTREFEQEFWQYQQDYYDRLEEGRLEEAEEREKDREEMEWDMTLMRLDAAATQSKALMEFARIFGDNEAKRAKIDAALRSNRRQHDQRLRMAEILREQVRTGFTDNPGWTYEYGVTPLEDARSTVSQALKRDIDRHKIALPSVSMLERQNISELKRRIGLPKGEGGIGEDDLYKLGILLQETKGFILDHKKKAVGPEHRELRNNQALKIGELWNGFLSLGMGDVNTEHDKEVKKIWNRAMGIIDGVDAQTLISAAEDVSPDIEDMLAAISAAMQTISMPEFRSRRKGTFEEIVRMQRGRLRMEPRKRKGK